MDTPKKIYISGGNAESLGYYSKDNNSPYDTEYIRADLAKLTWEDIGILQDAINETHSEYPCGLSAKCFGEEVLDKFYDRRK